MDGLRVVVAGAGGRMGQALIGAVAGDPDTHLAGALDRDDAGVLGQDSGVVSGLGENGIDISSDPLPLFAACDAVLDFTAPGASVAYAELTAQARLVHVIGTTGFDPAQAEKLRAAARHARIVKSGNMSLGVNL
ncbi:MAG TPA: 4-hydroxy-tetrahydrodipicolinate reductase, partial [Afifellaceae bacterium]|nr:4-hydroxy-tetrahydrodipicolinate reductase [Afifellaceae bacterium]